MPLSVRAEGEKAEEDAKPDEALAFEIAYCEALIECGFSDFAEPVMAATKKKWPESEAKFFAIEIRGMLALGKFEEAEKKIASLPDRKSPKYWAARLTLANNLFARDRKKDCSVIYDEFFAQFQNGKPPRELREFYNEACYAWGQLLIGDKRFEEAAKIYEGLIANIDKSKDEDSLNAYANVSAETAEMYLRLAQDATGAKRDGFMKSARKIVNDLLWLQEIPVYFGRAIAMKAHLELLNGDVKKAQETIDEYMDQLAFIHDQIVKFDPDGRQGLLKQSPMPLCRYLLADMMWKEAQAEAKKPKRDDERIKSLMFGDKVGGKRNGAGAFNHALTVFINYPESIWAASAGDLSEQIREFAEKAYNAVINTTVTAEQMAKVKAMQFKSANEKFNEDKFEEAITDYLDALSHSPEGMESVLAIENVIAAYRRLLRNEAKAKGDGEGEGAEKSAKWESLRLDLDAIEGYVGQRFAGHRDRRIMTAAGNTLVRAAAAEKQAGEEARAKALYNAFFTNYRRHANAGDACASAAQEAKDAGDFAEAVRLYELMGRYYTNNTFYAGTLAQLSVCYDKLGERQKSLEAMKRYVKLEPNRVRRDQAQMSLAQMYKKEGFDILANAETNETPEAVAKQMKQGSAQIVRGIQQFKDFAAKAEKALADPGITKADRKSYNDLREAALYLIGDSWRRMTKPESKLEEFRRRATADLEDYVAKYPEGQYARYAYVNLGTLYTALGDMEKSRDALDRLTTRFPDSSEAKNAKPRLAKNLIEMGLKKEGTEIYAEMLKTDGAYTAGQFLAAGEALIEAKSWETANQAFEKAISKAATNQYSTVARARLGEAKAMYRQGSLAEAREAIDLFLDDERMAAMAIAVDANFLLVDVASEMGRTERDATTREKHFAAAIGALAKVRRAWARTGTNGVPVKASWEQDKTTLMSADINVRRMKAEETMGLKDEADETRGRAASTLVMFLQTRGVSAKTPIGAMKPGELANLSRCYEMLVPLLAVKGKDEADRVIKFGNEYLRYFPNGRMRTEMGNFINQAKAEGGDAAVEPEESAASAEPEEEPAADEPAAEETAGESEKESEGEGGESENE